MKIVRTSAFKGISSLFLDNLGSYVLKLRHARSKWFLRSYSLVAVGKGHGAENTQRTKLAGNLACLIEETYHRDERKPKSRMELKRSREIRIKKRVKQHYMNSKFKELMKNVVACPETLRDAYDCLRLNSNVDINEYDERINFDHMAEELASGKFDVNDNVFSMATRGKVKEILVLPSVKLKVVQEAIRIVLEVVYKPHFSKISHGGRSGRGHASALKYIVNDMSHHDWWFTLLLNKKPDDSLFEKLITTMEERIEDSSLYSILHSMFDAQVLNLEFGGFPKGHGLPQEGILSPVLMNIYLDLFDSEFYRMSMRYEMLNPDSQDAGNSFPSKLRSWFRKQLKKDGSNTILNRQNGPVVHCCRFMDEIFLAVSGNKEVATELKSEVINFLQNSLLLNVDDNTEVLPCEGSEGLRFLGTLVRKDVKENPAVRAVHKLKEKVKLFALQKEEAWNLGTVRMGKKCLGHGLKKVKESEISQLADSSSTLSKISGFRKAGMETDHWYKVLVKVWMEDAMKNEAARNEEFILSKYVAEPALPQELRDSFYKFQDCVEKYVSSETDQTEALLSTPGPSNESLRFVEIIAPVYAIKKRLLRYGLMTPDGYARANSFLILQDTTQIIDWYSGIVQRWLTWYKDCSNFSEIKLMIHDQVRKSCIRTLGAKFRLHENEVEKRFDSLLCKVPSIQEIEEEKTYGKLDYHAYDNNELLTYGISYSGLCLLSLSRIVSESRPCNCFVIGCTVPAPTVFALHAMERQRFPGWKTGFSASIHPSLNRRKVGLCKQHLKDLYLGHISLQAIDFGAWR